MRIAALATALLVAASLAAEDAPARKGRPPERPAPAEGESSRPRSRENAERPPFRGEMAERLGRLKEAGVTPEEMSKLREAVSAAVIKADASLAATLEKMGELRNEFLGDRPREGSPRGPRPEGAKPKGPRPDGFEAVPAKSEGA